MPTRLTNKDYISILKYYNKKISKSKILVKAQAEKIMAQKLCRCIKKVDPIYEAKSIGICTKSIFNLKGLTRGQFQCKKKQSVKFGKKNKTLKIKKNINN